MEYLEPIDNFPIMELLIDQGIEKVYALQILKEVTNISYTSSTEVEISKSHDWGTGFNLELKPFSAFLSINQPDEMGANLFNLSQQLLRNSKNVKRAAKSVSFANVIKNRYSFSLDLDESRIIDGIKHLGGIIKSSDPALNFNINYQSSEILKNFQSTNYLNLTQEITQNIFQLQLSYTKGNANIHLEKTLGGIEQSDTNLDLMEEQVYNQLEIIENLKNASHSNKGSSPVILNPDTSFSLIHEGIGHAIEADQVISGNSYLSGSIGYAVSSNLLNVTDDSNLKKIGWFLYDDEGNKSQGTQIIEEGFLMNFLTNKQTSDILGMDNTSNARSTSYLNPPEPRQSNLYIEPGQLSMEELLEELKNGYVVGDTSLASTSVYSGEYEINSQYGYEVKNGEINRVVKPINIRDHAINSLSKINGIGKKLGNITSNCLKNYNQVYIGGLSPHLLIEEVFIT